MENGTRKCAVCTHSVVRLELGAEQMPSGCLFLRLGKYPFSKVLPKPSRYMAGPGLGYSDAGDWEPPGLDMKNQLQLGDVVVRERGMP